jgi:vitamin B12 transporter
MPAARTPGGRSARALVAAVLALAAWGTIRADDPSSSGEAPAASDQSVTVVAPRADDPGPSCAVLSGQALAARPAALGDPLRALAGSAGIASPSDYRSDLMVRGGEASDTAVLVDGLPLPSAFHFWGGAGSTGIVGASPVGQIQVSTGGFSAEYGDALAGVVDVSLRDDRPAALAGQASLSSVLADLTLAGPVGPGSFLVSGRGSDLALYEDHAGERGVRDVGFEDLLGDLRLPLPGGGRLDLTGFAAGSGFTQDLGGGAHGDLSGREHAAHARLELPIDARTLLRVLLAQGWLEASSGVDGGTRYEQAQEREDARLSVVRLLGQRHRLAAGLDLSRTHGTTAGVVDDGSGLVPGRTRDDAQGSGAFAEDLFRPGERVALRLGARADRWSATGRTVLSPRLAVEVRPTGRLALRVAAGRFVQFPRAEQIYLAGGAPLQVPIAEQLIVGVERRLGASLRLSLEAHRKRTRRPIAESINRYADLPESMAQFDAARIEGIDLILERGGPGPWLVRLDGSYLVAREKRDGAWFPADTDRRQAADLLLGRTFPRGWALSGALRYASGLPYSPLDPWSDGTSFGVRAGELNAARLPAYGRLDLRVGRSRPLSWGRIEVHLDLLNVTARANVRRVDLRYDAASGVYLRTVSYQSPFLPVFGVSASF